MKTNSARSAGAEEICKLLEQAILKYFPRPIESVDAFLFANSDDGAVGDLQAASPPEAPTATALPTVKRSLRFLCFA